MSERSFDLIHEPWIKVMEKETNQEKTVSLSNLFSNAQHYRQLAGDMNSQDLAILRFLLAILTTVYSRFGADGRAYDWLELNEKTFQIASFDEDDFDRDDLIDTWQKIYQQGQFSEIVLQYLARYGERFNLFGPHPFYQVTTADYDSFVPANKKIATGSGTVSIKQINRLISESNNTPDIFSPKSNSEKNKLSLAELVRWLITYQNFTGVTDKTKIKTDEKFSTSSGWLYKLNPVYLKGDSIFETLMLNLVLFNNKKYVAQNPVWEYPHIESYVTERKKQILPDDSTALYTTWSRLIHIEWDKNNQPTIFSAGLPIFGNENAFCEPMTTWKIDKQGGNDTYKPAVKSVRSLSKAMWRNFGQYINVEKTNSHKPEPGIVTWLHLLKNKGLIEVKKPLNLVTSTLISDGNATSQAPIFEIIDDLIIRADVLFDSENESYWPLRIENIIDSTQQIGNDFWKFAASIAQLRGLDSKVFAEQYSKLFYERLNVPFKQWLAGLSNNDDRDEKELQWKQKVKKIVLSLAEELTQSSTSRDISGITTTDKGTTKVQNIFTANNYLRYNIQQHLNI